jgi:hypothetical protein
LFSCANVDTDELPATFADADGDGLADGIGSSDTGQAYIRDVNGEPTEGQVKMVPNVEPEDGRITFTVIAAEADCVVPVAFDDRGPADELRLDLGHRDVGKGSGVAPILRPRASRAADETGQRPARVRCL